MIYLILCAGFKDNNPDQFEKRLKIGYTDNLENRLKAYSTTNPDFILLQTREGDTTIESYLHKRFEKYKYKDCREWFYYDDEIIDNFQCNLEDYIDENLLLDYIKKDLRSRISSILELREKYLNKILEEIKSSPDFSEEFYDEEVIIRIVTNTWKNGINCFNSSIDSAKLVDYKPIDLFNYSNEEDITVEVDLPQILGRQRLLENPWKNRAELYVRFLCKGKVRTEDQFKKYLDLKISKTESLLRSYNNALSMDKHDLAETYQKVTKSYNYRDDFVAVNTHDGSDLVPVFNKLVMLSEKRAFDIQQLDYKDRFSVFNSIFNQGYELDPSMIIVNDFLDKFKSYPYFTDKMRLLCEFDCKDKRILSIILSQIPIDYGNYYILLGPDKIKALCYKKGELDKVCQKMKESSSDNLKNIIITNFSLSERVTKSDAKTRLQIAFKENNIITSPKATLILDYFEVKKTKVKNSEGKFVDGYELLKLKE